MNHYFIFGGKSTENFDMHIEKLPAVKGATRKRTTVSVPGRNGDLHYTEEAFTNYKQPYDCYFHGELPTAVQAHAIKAWLMASGKYLKLEDTYDPGPYRKATFIGPIDVDNYFNKYGRCTVYFDCAPLFFLKSGDHPVTFTATGAIYNPTSRTTLPLITVYGSGAGTVTVGGVTVKIKEISTPMILDCDREDAYMTSDAGDSVNANANIYAPDFPKLKPGENTVTFAGGISKVEIIPRWWEL